jgi:hypothetical protein
MEFNFSLKICLVVSALIICLHISACKTVNVTANKITADFVMTEDTVYSASSTMRVLLPRGWTAGENSAPDFWLIKNDFSASVTCMPLKFSRHITFQPDSDSLVSILNYSRSLKSAATGRDVSLKENEFFILNGRHFGAYEYFTEDGRKVRIAVFRYGNRYFEISAVPAPGIKENSEDLFKAHQAVLNSIK